VGVLSVEEWRMRAQGRGGGPLPLLNHEVQEAKESGGMIY
jgi:hypothetical protein